MTVLEKKRRAPKKKTPSGTFDPDAPHTPNAETRRALEECRKDGGTPVTRDGLRKMWDEA